ncbi:XRE family transcriptional regulator [bacterium]|nr:XRE family transcriptional regulator [bacterium]
MMNRLKELREDKDLFQKDIAKYLNMSQTGYSQYETETNDIPTEVLKNVADFYDTSIDYLLYRTDERKPYPKSILSKNNLK